MLIRPLAVGWVLVKFKKFTLLKIDYLGNDGWEKYDQRSTSSRKITLFWQHHLIFLSHFFPKSSCADLKTHPTFVSSTFARGLMDIWTQFPLFYGTSYITVIGPILSFNLWSVIWYYPVSHISMNVRLTQAFIIWNRLLPWDFVAVT